MTKPSHSELLKGEMTRNGMRMNVKRVQGQLFIIPPAEWAGLNCVASNPGHGSDFLTPFANAIRICRKPKTESAAISSVTQPMQPVPTRPLRFVAILAVVRTRRIGPVVRARISGESASSRLLLRHL
jgi:hypothetical protein